MGRLRVVMDALADRPLEAYRDTDEDLHGFCHGRPICWEGISDSSEAGLDQLCETIAEWSKAWGLDADWVRTAALNALHAWCTSAEARELRLWGLISYRVTGARVYKYKRAGWNGVGSFNAYKRAAKNDLVRQVDQELRDEEAALRESGPLPPEPGRRGERSYIWTARSQILGDPISRIADEYDVHQRTVSESVERLLSFIKLPRRPRRVGRPLGSTDRHRAG